MRKERLDKFIKEGKLDNKRIIIFGSINATTKIIDYLKQNNIVVNAIIDNNKDIEGNTIRGITIYTPEHYLVPFKKQVIIFVTSYTYYQDIVCQLKQLGYNENEHVYPFIEQDSNVNIDISKMEFEKRLHIIKQGERVFQQIRKIYLYPTKIFIYSRAHLGDQYISFIYMREYINCQRIKEFVVVVPIGIHADIAELFIHKDKLVVINNQDLDAFLQYSIFVEGMNGQIFLLNPMSYITHHGKNPGRCGSDIYKYGLYNLPLSSQPMHPNIIYHCKENREYISSLFKTESLKNKKTVLLCPYSNSLPELNSIFWRKLVSNLWDKGFIVCTNVSGGGSYRLKGR